MYLVFKLDGKVCLLTMSDELLSQDVDHMSIGLPYDVKFFIKNKHDIPVEPIQSWILTQDGQIEIDQDKLAQFNQSQMPTLSPIEFDIKLNNAGLYDAVQDLIKDKFELRIAYNRATFFSRTDPFIDQARIALNLTDEQVDEMWMN